MAKRKPNPAQPKEYELTAKIKMEIPKNFKMDNLVRLKELGLDIEQISTINEISVKMLQDKKLNTNIAECLFDQDFSKEAGDLDSTVVREAMVYFLSKRCGVHFQGIN